MVGASSTSSELSEPCYPAGDVEVEGVEPSPGRVQSPPSAPRHPHMNGQPG